MNMGRIVVSLSVKRPRLVTAVMVGASVVLVSLAILPTLWPNAFQSMHSLRVDTDPENMLRSDESVRLFHKRA